MLSFLLGLLKIVGIVLLILFLTVLVAVALVLFVPIRYQGYGVIDTEKKAGRLNATWLLKIVRFQLEYTFPQKPLIKVRVLGIDIMKLFNKPPKQEKPPKIKKKAEASVNHYLLSEETEDTLEAEETKIERKTEKQVQPSENKIIEKSGTETDGMQDENEAAAKKVSLRDKIEKIIFKIKSIYDKIKSILYNIQYYIELLQEEDTQILIANAKEAIMKILKSIRPKEFLLAGYFGFDTPDTTGKVYGYYCMAMPWIGDYVQLVPDFEAKRLEGELKFKGSITVFVILINGLRILFDKRLKPLIKKLKHGGKQNGR